MTERPEEVDLENSTNQLLEVKNKSAKSNRLGQVVPINDL